MSLRAVRPVPRGVVVDHTTLYCWIQAYAPELDRLLRPHLQTIFVAHLFGITS